MWKVIALVAAIALFLPAAAGAAEKATPEVRQKQMEELGAIRGRIIFKLEELRRVFSQPALGVRSTAISDVYTKTRAAVNNKIGTENAKPIKDQPTLDALALKLQNMDEALNKSQRAWTVFQNAINDQADVSTYLNTLMQLCNLDDNWNRSEIDVQLLVNVAAAIEARVDLARTKMGAAIADIGKAFDEIEPVMKE